MMKNSYEKGVVAQKNQVEQGVERINQLKSSVNIAKEETKSQSEALDELQNSVDSLFSQLGIDISKLDLSNADNIELVSKEEIESVNKKYDNMFSPLQTIEFNSYEDYLKKVDDYLNSAGIDTSIDPIKQLFTEEELKKALDKYKETYGKLEWNKLDYTIIGISAVVAILLDFFIVRIPPTRVKVGDTYKYSNVANFNGKEYKGSSITKFIQEKTTNAYVGKGDDKLSSWLHDGIKKMEDYAKVPYDKSINKGDINIDGLNPKFHRLMSLGHDPILGFIFGVIDILRGTMTAIDKNGVLQIVDIGEGSYNIFSAFVKVFAHFLSDICSPMGIAPPFMSLLQLITGKTPFILGKSGEKVSANNVIRFMYKHGYDMRHMMTMGIVPLTVELIIRTYYNLYYYSTLIDHEKDIRHKYKKNGMLTIAHSATMSGNIIKMWLYGWNPTAFNYSEFLMLTKTLISFCKVNKEYNKWLEGELRNNWIDIARWQSGEL